MKRKINYELIDAIIEQGITQKELSRKAGLSNSYISNIVNGIHHMTIPAARKLAPFLPGYDMKKALSESGAKILFVAELNPAVKMIVELLKDEKISQKKLAIKAGVACSTMHYILGGTLMVSYMVARKIQEAYPQFNADTAIRRQRLVFGNRCSTTQYQQRWKTQWLQN